MTYVDGFVLPVPKADFEAYKKHAELGKAAWLEHGALSYMEAVSDDMPDGKLTSFPMAVKQEKDDVIVFSYATYKSREHRDEVMKKVMEDPRFAGQEMPPYFRRMIYGGFEAFVES